RGQEDVEAAAAAEVEHGLAGAELRVGDRIAAAEPEVGARRGGGGLAVRVAEILHGIDAGAAAAAIAARDAAVLLAHERADVVHGRVVLERAFVHRSSFRVTRVAGEVHESCGAPSAATRSWRFRSAAGSR